VVTVGNLISDEDREFIRIFLADAFTGIQLNKEGIDRLRKFPIGEVRQIFFREVSVACSFNLTTTTPEIGGFDPRWVKAEIFRILYKKNSSIFAGIAFEVRALFSGCASFGVWCELKKLLDSPDQIDASLF
jgi:hypothetical protein